MTAAQMVQTRCGCGHSVAAHTRGPCQGIDVFGGGLGRWAVGLALCECQAVHETVTVPAAPLAMSP